MAIPTALLRRGAAAALLAAGLAACGESGPSTFDPAATSADVAAIDAAFASPVFASFTMADAEIDAVVGGGSSPVVVSAGALRAARTGSASAYAASLRKILVSRSGTGASAMSASVAGIPTEVAGKTFVWDATAARYVASDRPSVGDTKVRFALYAIDPLTHLVAEPVNEIGYADLSDLSSGSTGEVRIELFSGTTTTTKLVDYRVRATPSASGGTITVSGFVSNGTTQADFDLDNIVSLSESNMSVTLDYGLSVPSRDVEVDFRLILAGAFESSLNLDLDYELAGPNGEVGITGGGVDGDAEFTVRVNGDEFATITTTETTITILGADGQALTAQEQEALQRVFELFEAGYGTFADLLSPVGGMVGGDA